MSHTQDMWDFQNLLEIDHYMNFEISDLIKMLIKATLGNSVNLFE